DRPAGPPAPYPHHPWRGLRDARAGWGPMKLRELWRTTPFRLTLMNGAVFALAVLALMGLIYQQTAGYLGREMDGIVISEARALKAGGAEKLPERVDQAV